MGRKGFPDEQKWSVAEKVESRALTVREAASMVGVSMNTVYRWLTLYRAMVKTSSGSPRTPLQIENCRLKAELQRVTEERDILKKAARLFAQSAA